jgi:transcriptional regulator with XRE-family HTH domain
MDKAPKYKELGATITDARLRAELTQSALARALEIKQQSVSRWEAGTHRPAIDQMDVLAKTLKVPITTLLRLAGTDSRPALAVAPHFPLNMLAPEIFERFIGDLVSYLHSDRSVRVRGGRGHDQGGWDVLATGAQPTIGIQCKQVERFGPADAKRAIAAVDRPVDRAILALSRVISPATADVLEAAGWEVWDQDDISRKIRQLPGELQDNLVDDFFRGQRLALLGRDNPGPWVKPDRFFAPFDQAGGAFSHSWELVGREAELDALDAALDGPEPVVIVSGAGGMGKSRLIKTGVERYAASHPATLVRYLSAVGEPDHRSLEALGTRPKLLIVDDAHDRDGLPLLVDYVANPANQARLLLVTRPYAEQRIRNDLARYAMFKPAEIKLGVLPKVAIRDLAEHALDTFEGDPRLADVVLDIAADNPLVAVMAARVIAEQGLSPEMVRSAGDMRAIVIERFTQVLTGRIGLPEDSRLLRDMLGLIALLQPVRLDDREIGQLLEAVASHAAPEASRALRLLIDGGVLYKRGRAYRLMPDLLGDYLIDDICIQADGRLSLFAERVLKTVDDRLLVQVMVNLGRLDWRRHGGDPTESRLLDAAWARFRDIDQEWDPRIDAVRAVAVYQPAQALRFVSDRLRGGKSFREAAPILSNIVYTSRYRDEALRLLWEMGRDDQRDTGPNPSHPIRVLAELCEFGDHKPYEFSQEIADFAFGLMDEDRNWEGRHTPLEIVAPILKGTIDRTRAKGRSIMLSSAFVNYEYAVDLRSAVIDRIVSLLENPNPRVAAIAASFLHNAVQMPYGLGSSSPPEDIRDQYDREFAETIGRVSAAAAGGKLTSTTLLAIADAVGWHAEYGAGRAGEVAQSLLDQLPADLDFRLRAAMVDRARFAFRGQVQKDDWDGDVEKWLPELASEVSAAWPDPAQLLDQVEAAIGDLSCAGISDGSAYMLLAELVRDNLALARALIARASTEPGSVLRAFVWSAMAQILYLEPDEGRRLISRFIDHDRDMAFRAVTALGSLPRALDAAEIDLLRRAVSTPGVEVSRAGLMALRWLKDMPDAQVKAIALLAPIEQEPLLLHDVAALLLERHRKLITLLDRNEVETLLARMKNIRDFEGHWVEELLKAFAQHFAEPFAAYLFDRTDRALEDENSDIDLLGYRFHEGKLGFHKSPDATSVLDRAWAWLRQHDNDEGYKVYRAAEFVAGMFDIDADIVVQFLDAKLDFASAIELKWIAKLVRHTHHEFPFKQRRFVERFLDRSAAAGADVIELALDTLSAAALSGMRSGTLGAPMPRDLKARDAALEVMHSMPRLSPAYPLYEAILRDAERDIARSIREGEAYDAEEAE